MNRNSSGIRHAAALTYLGAIVYLAYLYCAVPVRWIELKFATGVFYRDLQLVWFATDKEKVEGALTNGRYDEWTQIWLRTAMARWRLQNQSRLPFEALMDRWDNGLLSNMPSRRQWMQMLEENDKQWLAARREFLEDGLPQLTPTLVMKDASLHVVFPAAAPTAHLGSMVEVFLECPEADVPTSVPGIMWGTQGSPPGGHQIRTVSIRRTAPGDDVSGFVMVLDLSWEPAYLTKNATGLILIARDIKPSWVAVKAVGSDSPLLPVPQGTSGH